MLKHLPPRSTIYTTLLLLLGLAILTAKHLGIARLVEIVPEVGLVWQAPRYTAVAVPTPAPAPAPAAAPTGAADPLLTGVCAVSSLFAAREAVCVVGSGGELA